MEFEVIDIIGTVSRRTFEKGADCQLAGRVLDVQVLEDANTTVVTGRVRHSNKQAYSVFVEVDASVPESPAFDGDCSCEAGYNCQHVVAVLLEAEVRTALDVGRKPAGRSTDIKPTRWPERIPQARPVAAGQQGQARTEKLLYLLEAPVAQGDGVVLPVRLVTCRILKQGGYGTPAPFSVRRAWQAHPARLLEPSDIETLRQAEKVAAGADDTLELSGELGARLLAAMIDTGRCHVEDPHEPALSPGGPRRASIEWDMDESGNQWLAFRTDPPSPVLLPVCPPWYVDLERQSAGPLESEYEPRLAGCLALAPNVALGRHDDLPPALESLLREARLPRPRRLRVRELRVSPTPVLRLIASESHPGEQKPAPAWVRAQDLPCRARLSFDYGGHELDPAELLEAREAPTVVRDGDEFIRVHQDEEAEADAVDELVELGLAPWLPPPWAFELTLAAPGLELAMRAASDDDERGGWFELLAQDVPDLRERGWRIEVADDFDHRLLVPEAWTASLEEGESSGWFDIQLGVDVDGERISLLPVLHELAGRAGARASKALMSELDTSDAIVVRYRDAWLSLPSERVRAILTTLAELFDPRLELNHGALRVSALRAEEMEELDAPIGGVGWSAGAQPRIAALAQRVRAFTSAQARAAPEGFLAELRPYQERGLGWLQALARLGLGGILADDMGLGKTVQTLAHLLLEKQSGRLGAPCLVVAPTSVVPNWVVEARRFAPQLRVLVLHGASRHERFDAIEDHDLVITTYALARRDRDRLAEQRYRYLILDEAQAIKNPRAVARQALRDLSAEHRLCLTGTPFENHLGELWSLVDFLEPGVLGSERQFQHLFRRPIEREGNTERRQRLARRIAPLLLRRTKQEIDEQLPEKTEIVQHVELTSDQRDLYETVRLVMQRKVRQALSKQGFEQSRIVVLDALLKLRQICCHPALVKLDAARQVRSSAKLDRLVEMLGEMIEEGRRVLVFSQFTAMLALIEARLEAAQVEYVKLTGRTRDRARPVERFQSGAVPVFLISLKAGGTGLNLTAADTVIHYDPWWNPAVEAQASDRAHRIGQKNKVFVYKLISAGTVESRMLELQDRKRSLVSSLLGETADAGGADLSREDLERLFEPLG